MAALKKTLKLLVKAKGGGSRTKYFKTKESYNRWLKDGRGKPIGKGGQTQGDFKKSAKAMGLKKPSAPLKDFNSKSYSEEKSKAMAKKLRAAWDKESSLKEKFERSGSLKDKAKMNKAIKEGKRLHKEMMAYENKRPPKTKLPLLNFGPLPG